MTAKLYEIRYLFTQIKQSRASYTTYNNKNDWTD